MFAISYSVPQQPGVDLRSAYFDGQRTGWNQMAEVAADRNDKRRINLDQQRVNLAARTEERLRREGIEQRKLERLKIENAGQVDPIIQAQREAELAKTRAETQQMLSNLQQSASYPDRANDIQRAALSSAEERQAAEARAAQRAETAKTPTSQELTKETARQAEGGRPTATTSDEPIYRGIQRATTEYLRRNERQKLSKTQQELIAEGQQRVTTLFQGLPTSNKPTRVSAGTSFGATTRGTPFVDEGIDFAQYGRTPLNT
jgi:hypothetical protein